ncbi:response regulator [Rhizobium anhuiense]|uniref:Response regulator n=1 Tax=Rhizobium anhuiense TaxID=1184720 RepID=A0A3S0SUT8_9HYPH|nr:MULTISPECIES: response regulator [Rhizobium]MBB3298857.1 CheY-like chemotaxis protein [Rhizobium sp. BK112]MBB3367235.1 CheY-like chemotaxis protein [Rhizobium sp. BK077]MBB3742063.1 CheY-like chemotaxis protein [Rhizobium sp. BK591]MBB4178749.1 CheY-like chemotaxis protein [Rhizobium sp. BK109]MBB4218710.1 CheY-like chemotaxis protein [Rhizobium sp. BK212]
MTHPHGRHAVLVVEDEPLLMMMAVDVVEAVGLEALEATNADDAVLILERRSDIAIVLTEVEVPGTMDGLALAALVRERWPLIEIVVVSGRVTIGREGLPERGVFFSKPYDADELAYTLRRLATYQVCIPRAERI